jgi:hypothetical protein
VVDLLKLAVLEARRLQEAEVEELTADLIKVLLELPPADSEDLEEAH